MSKLTVEIDLEDLFADEADQPMSEIVEDAIRYEVRAAIGRKVTDSIKEEVAKVVNKSLQDILTETFAATISKKVEGGLRSLLIDRGRGKETVLDWVGRSIGQSLNCHVDESLSRRIQKEIKSKVDALEAQYNSNFATEIISKLKEGGFLSEKAEQVLLTTKEEQK